MKTMPDITFPTSSAGRRPALLSRRMTVAGFTLVELMVALGIFGFIIAAMCAVQIFGMRVQTLAATKLIATTSGRETLNAMRDQIRSAPNVNVGIYTPSNLIPFTLISNGFPEIGNALQLVITNGGSTNYIYYYQDPSTNEVISFSNNYAHPYVVAQYMTNYYCFDAEDYRFWIYPTNILTTNYINNPVIGVTMSFSQWEYPIGYIGGNKANAYDYYYLRTHITRRMKQ